MSETILRRLEQESPLRIFLLGLAIIAFFSVPDYLVGPQIATSILYVVPVAIVAWANGMRDAVIIAFIASLDWIAVDIASGVEFDHPVIGVWNTLTRFAVYITVSALLANLRAARNAAHRLSMIDHLTGVANTRAFYQMTEHEMQRARRERSPITVVYVDVDNFKTINDTLGHDAGDALLVDIAAALRQSTRATDIVARLGGDEFAIIMPDIPIGDAASVVAALKDRVALAIGEHADIATLSVGAVTFIEPPHHIDDLVKSADDLMYAAKEAGKNVIRHAVVSTASRSAGREPYVGVVSA